MIQTGIWWVFLALGPVLYWLLPARWRMGALAAASIALLAPHAGWDLALMAAVAALVFLGRRWPRLAAHPGPWAAWAVFLYFLWGKYLPALEQVFSGGGAGPVLIPLGISYFSFKLLHYAIEARRGNLPAHGVDDFTAWLFLAPIFTAGPIERFEHFLKEREIARFETRFVTEAVLRIAQGLVKKFVFGMIVLELIDRVTHGAGMAGIAASGAAPWVVWAGLFLSIFFVYLDFSAYSDIAIGSARLFGLKIMENFDLPFLAPTLQAFWQRWHMTLANWCRAYIYMTLIGYTRNPYTAVIVTFGAMGLWHAASLHWLGWGLWHGLGLAWLMFWGQFSRKRGIGFFKTAPGTVAGWALTVAWAVLGNAFTVVDGVAPFSASLRLIGIAFGLGG